MNKDKEEIKSRKPNRLAGYGYSQNGMYFLTICTKDREELLGEIKNGEMVLNELGKIVKNNLLGINNYFKNVFLDKFVIMPNHVHCIVEINNDICRGGPCVRPDMKGQAQGCGQTQGLSLRLRQDDKQNIGLLSRVIQRFKSKSTVEYIQLMKSKNISCITCVWQRSFYDHIIRNEKSLSKIREYIQINPRMWDCDRNNVENIWM